MVNSPFIAYADVEYFLLKLQKRSTILYLLEITLESIPYTTLREDFNNGPILIEIFLAISHDLIQNYFVLPTKMVAVH